MPEQRAYTVWTYDEADDDLKQKILEKHRDINLHDNWWDFTHDDAISVGALIGIEVGEAKGDRKDMWFSGFSHQGSGLCWGGVLRLNLFAGATTRLKEAGYTEDRRLLELASECEQVYADILSGLRKAARSDATKAAVEQRLRDTNVCVGVKSKEHFGHSSVVDLDGREYSDLYESYQHAAKPVFARRNDDNDSGIDAAFSSLEDDMGSVAESFANWVYRQLEQESEYLESDDSVEETLRANEYKFTESGDID